MNHQEMLSRAEREVSTRANNIAALDQQNAVDHEHDKAFGYISALRDMGIFDADQYVSALGVLGAALSTAQLRTKKAAPGAGNTESDKAKSINFSLEQKAGDVKTRPEAFVHADIYSGTNLRMEMYGEVRQLLAILACYTHDLRRNGIPESEIQKVYLKGFMEREGKTNA